MASTRRQRSGLRGVGKLRRQLRRLPDEVTQPVREAIVDSADFLEFQMLSRVPRDEGDLAGSIEKRFGRDGFSAEVGPGARTKTARRRAGWRAHFAEFGTQKMPATPFVFPSLEYGRHWILKRIEDAVDRVLRRASRL